MGPLAMLFPINPRSIARLLDDIHEVAVFARDVGPRIDRFNDVGARMGDAASGIGELGARVEDLGVRYEALAQAFLGLASRLDQLIGLATKITGPFGGAVERVGRMVPGLSGERES
jgi:hypothetical protein